MKNGERYYAKGYNVPTDVRYCKRCVMSNQRPRITFDEHGVCSACNFSDFKESLDWSAREAELRVLLDKYRKNDGSYDVIVPSSGGKDSAFVAHMLKFKYNMNPLTVTWAPHLYTDIGFENHQAHIHVGDLANILVTPPGKTHRKLTKLAFEHLGDPFLPFIYGQNNMPLQMAERYGISLIFYGENSEVEYGGNMADAFVPTRDWKFKNTNILMSGMPPETFLEHGITKNDLIPYLPPSVESLEKINLEIHYFGYYYKWIPQENYYYCVENTGFKANPVRSEGTYSKYASLDDRIDGFHYWLMFIKFGIGRATSDAAHEVRDGHITREEAVALVGRFDGEFPMKNYKTFLEYCGITEEEFFKVVDSWRPDHLWSQQDSGEWILRHKVDGSGLDD
ncbi:N-acetyl sugar amidotransferase [Vibrio cholerae]|uniref:N-acetyl sugar amidotransferase n=1 Tax=Vibrio cholerae TaxID=666 RepID=UPI001EB2B591|nr:N-acetyl sugar amidotransferase [Vibrio cholerae]EGQ7944301.1 N-acetyl sugar amidotransferase [Vibrio cholerae]MDV2397109.1 N-acetyl sugar amidotransferase [Vibrio cholerae]